MTSTKRCNCPDCSLRNAIYDLIEAHKNAAEARGEAYSPTQAGVIGALTAILADNIAMFACVTRKEPPEQEVEIRRLVDATEAYLTRETRQHVVNFQAAVTALRH